MMKNLTVTLLLLLLTSCKPQGIIERTTIIRDTTIYVHLPADTLYDTVVAREGAFSILNSGYASSVAWINSGKLFHRLDQQEKHLPVNIKQAVKTTTNALNNTSYPSGRDIHELTTFQKIQVFLGNALLIGLAGWIALRLISNLTRHRA